MSNTDVGVVLNTAPVSGDSCCWSSVSVGFPAVVTCGVPNTNQDALQPGTAALAFASDRAGMGVALDPRLAFRHGECDDDADHEDDEAAERQRADGEADVVENSHRRSGESIGLASVSDPVDPTNAILACARAIRQGLMPGRCTGGCSCGSGSGG